MPPASSVSKPIGKSADNMYSYLALVQDDPTVQVVNNAQKRREHFIQGDPDLAKLLVRCPPRRLKLAGVRTDPASFVEAKTADLPQRRRSYLYPNTLVVVKASGKEVKRVQIVLAGQFNQIGYSQQQTANR